MILTLNSEFLLCPEDWIELATQSPSELPPPNIEQFNKDLRDMLAQ